MLRHVSLLTLAGAVTFACSPEVLIATNEAGASGAAGVTSAGSGGAGTGGMATAGAGMSGSGVLPLSGSSNDGGSPDGAGGTPDVVPPARLLADSVADFTLTQGAHGWYYGTDNGTVDTFTLMTRKSVITMYEPVSKDNWVCWAAEEPAHWAQLFRLGAHPNGTSTSPPAKPGLARAVRRWVSNFDGNVIVSGEAAKIDLVDSNGVDVFVYVDGVQHFSKSIAGDDAGGTSFEFGAALRVGSNVDFVVDAHTGDDHHDLTRFIGAIARDEEQSP